MKKKQHIDIQTTDTAVRMTKYRAMFYINTENVKLQFVNAEQSHNRQNKPKYAEI